MRTLRGENENGDDKNKQIILIFYFPEFVSQIFSDEVFRSLQGGRDGAGVKVKYSDS